MDAGNRPAILDRMSALSDGLRSRILLVLERQELTVSELCSVLQLPQSTVSRHLKILVDAGWIASRPEGTRRLYRMPLEEAEGATRDLWLLAREPLQASATVDQDAQRLQSVLAHRRSLSKEFFDSAAGRWDGLRDELFGPDFFLAALFGLLEEDSVVADLGCGSGAVAEALAPFVGRLIALDGSRAMLAAARKRLEHFDNVELRRGELERLPIESGSVDAATLILVLHHLPDPGGVVSEVARVLKPSGKLLIVDMLPHERHEYQAEMGHVWMGFSAEQLERYLAAAGLRQALFRPLAPARAAKGPSLFAATARLVGAPVPRQPGKQSLQATGSA